MSGHYGAPAEPGADDYADQVMPLIHGSDITASISPAQSAHGCGLCGLPYDAHDGSIGAAGHEFAARAREAVAS